MSHDDRVASRVIMFELLRECAGGRFVGYLHIVVHGTTCIGCTLQMLASIVSDVRDAHGIGTAAAWQQYDSLICTALALHLQESGRKAASQPTQQLSWYLYSNSASWPSYTVAISVTARHEARHGIGTAAAYTPYGSGTAAARQRHGSDTAAAWLLHGCVLWRIYGMAAISADKQPYVIAFHRLPCKVFDLMLWSCCKI